MGWHVDKLQHKQDLTKAEKTQDKLGLELQYWKLYSRTLRSIQMYYNKTTAAKCCKSNEYSCASCHCYHSVPVSFSASSSWFGYVACSKLKCGSQVTGQDTIFLKKICRFAVMDLPRGELCSSTMNELQCFHSWLHVRYRLLPGKKFFEERSTEWQHFSDRKLQVKTRCLLWMPIFVPLLLGLYARDVVPETGWSSVSEAEVMQVQLLHTKI